jgi:predicted metal-dependent enzyme (double-stranded beta helix superfamily)
MSAVAVYTLDEFVKDLQDAFASHPDLVGRANAVADVLGHLLKVGGWVQELIDKGGYESLPGSTYTDATYGHPAAGFHITCGAQKPGQANAPHDHGAGWVAYGTYEGAIQQTRWGWDYADGLLKPRLVAKESFVQNPGEVAYFLPGEIHDTRNVAERSVVVRVESQKVATLWRHRYLKDGNTARAFMEESVPTDR